jgi:hypothetical protein
MVCIRVVSVKGGTGPLFNLHPAVEHAQAGRDAARWQDATTLRARARKEEQRRQRAAARLD